MVVGHINCFMLHNFPNSFHIDSSAHGITALLVFTLQTLDDKCVCSHGEKRWNYHHENLNQQKISKIIQATGAQKDVCANSDDISFGQALDFLTCTNDKQIWAALQYREAEKEYTAVMFFSKKTSSNNYCPNLLAKKRENLHNLCRGLIITYR